ncbi:JAB domain-containing protein [Marinobacterium halophilum]|uniref:JAB domain-containing protein n=1 Tax=Marinobacterium halophilum TaxID=267374 RepID=UPI000D0D46FC|nr:JAB domain-containing protein [Marinobacterium halophilum]
MDALTTECEGQLERRAIQLAEVCTNRCGWCKERGESLPITASIKDALQVFDIRVLDHFIVAPGESCSFAERGLL